MPKISFLLTNSILLLDGSTGTYLQGFNLTAEDFGGESYFGCNEQLVLTRPDVVTKVHEAYLDAGADIIETNTFGGTSIVLADYGLEGKAAEINRAAAGLAREAADRFSTPDKPRFVAGAMGPTTKSLSLTGGITFDEMASAYAQQAAALIEGGCDYLLLETAMDTLNLKAAYLGIQQALKMHTLTHQTHLTHKTHQTHKTIPVAISVTIEQSGTMLAGQGIEALYTSIEHIQPLYVGLNCATGPEKMKEHIRSLADISRYPIAIVPNAGMPDENGHYTETPESMAETLAGFAKEGWINVVGGCCGTTPEHIRAVAQSMKGIMPRKVTPPSDAPITNNQSPVTRVSGIEPLTIDDEGRPYIVGERANVIGSRLFKNLISEEKFDEAVETVRRQVKAGAHIIDVCVSNPDRDEKEDMISLLSKARSSVKVPFMIDSQDRATVEAAFKLVQGKCILNSINLENGEKTFEELVPLVKQYGAAVIVGCISEKMALTAKDKLTIASQSYDLLTQKYGLDPADIIFDPLVFPCGTGEEHYFGSGKETIEAVRLIKERYPQCKTLLGVSNVSFGLPPAGREALNSALLYHATQAGLELAIVNAAKIVRYGTLSAEEKKLCDDLLWYNTNNNNNPISSFVAYYRDKGTQAQRGKREEGRGKIEKKDVGKRLEDKIMEGSKDKLREDLSESLKTQTPLEIINGPLMAGMSKVGEMFKNNELIVAEVLQSAEVMNAAVSYLEPLMEDKNANIRGTMLLATVTGDVHDIGKNLTHIILSNNGFQVRDLGIKCAAQTIIESYQQQPADMIGLSGLLVKSVQQMAITAKDLKTAGISVPLLLGGAALSKRFVEEKIVPEYDGPVFYCPDAMTGLESALEVTSRGSAMCVPNSRKSPLNQREEGKGKREEECKGAVSPPHNDDISSSPSHPFTEPPRPAPHTKQTLFTSTPEQAWAYLNETMIYTRHLGFKGPFQQKLAEGDAKAAQLKEAVDTVKQKVIQDDLFDLKGVFRFFPSASDGNSIILYQQDKELERFTFPRQVNKKNLCLADYVIPATCPAKPPRRSGKAGKVPRGEIRVAEAQGGLKNSNTQELKDSICLFVVTCGHRSEIVAKQWVNEGKYLDAQILTALAFETVEALAEVIHQHIRDLWGLPDNKTLSKQNILQAKYTGCRFSFGYPACPDMKDQVKLWALLSPDQAIGVTLSEGYMMSPEASVSAMVFHHPEAKYFSI